MKNLIKLGAIAGVAFTGAIMANTLNLSLDAGVAFSQLSNNAAVTPVDGLTKTYTATENRQSAPFAGIGAEYVLDHLTAMPFTLGLGLSAYYIDLGNISGTETPGSTMGLTDALNYSMKASSAAILFEPRFTYTAYHLQPYVLTGIGCAWNTLSHFTETTPAGSHATPSNPYGSHTEGSFAYELGAGAQYPLMTNLLFRLEYRYLNVGNAALGAASGQTTSERLSSKNISSNVIDVGLSYEFQ